jgi:hypothetical protein
MDPGGDACANAEFLLLILDEITESILMSAEACPKFVIKFIANCLADTETSFFFVNLGQFDTSANVCRKR